RHGSRKNASNARLKEEESKQVLNVWPPVYRGPSSMADGNDGSTGAEVAPQEAWAFHPGSTPPRTRVMLFARALRRDAWWEASVGSNFREATYHGSGRQSPPAVPVRKWRNWLEC